MLYARGRKTVPSSAYGIDLDILEATGWTWQEWQTQPATLCTEMRVKFAKRARQQAKDTDKANRTHGKKR